MTTVGAYEAKTHLAELLARVAQGESILITKHGQPVAQLVPPEAEDKPDPRGAMRRIRELRKGVTLGPELTIRDLIEEGRRF
ncbi:MAG TPA: type II toxin-antitoxin system prevent-host-death family antitoxin [Planctomycetales bacterium]|jgi:prevent-host-death family protein|nr:type II toxin-antitoxin system prevent-host-death family antitoxin [Planctomycetales bacterium]